MPNHDIIVVGASAGGVEALMTIVRGLSADLPASIFVVLHVPAQGPSILHDLLNRAGTIPAAQATDGALIEQGHIYVAPPDNHLLVHRDHMRTVRGPKENRHRPAVDVLFRSAAVAYGPRVVGVVLTGSLDDGTAGLLAIKRRGGLAIVQDPQEALYPGMPSSAMQNVQIDYCLPLAEIPATLTRLSHDPAPNEEAFPVPEDMKQELRITQMDMEALNNAETVGAPSVFSCPECGGVLWEVHDGDILRFRCRVGHAYSTDSMLADQKDTVEEALWSALKTLEENVDLCDRLYEQAKQRGNKMLIASFQDKVNESKRRAGLIRRVLFNGEMAVPEIHAVQDVHHDK